MTYLCTLYCVLAVFYEIGWAVCVDVMHYNFAHFKPRELGSRLTFSLKTPDFYEGITEEMAVWKLIEIFLCHLLTSTCFGPADQPQRSQLGSAVLQNRQNYPPLHCRIIYGSREWNMSKLLRNKQDSKNLSFEGRITDWHVVDLGRTGMLHRVDW
jgi:hypothetical protein